MKQCNVHCKITKIPNRKQLINCIQSHLATFYELREEIGRLLSHVLRPIKWLSFI